MLFPCDVGANRAGCLSSNGDAILDLAYQQDGDREITFWSGFDGFPLLS